MNDAMAFSDPMHDNPNQITAAVYTILGGTATGVESASMTDGTIVCKMRALLIVNRSSARSLFVLRFRFRSRGKRILH